MKSSSSSGQVLLITLLVLTVATTIGLAFIGRVRTDTTSSADVEESARAFSAAEAGIEEALKSGTGTSQPRTLSDVPASYSTSISTVGSAPGIYAFPQLTTRGDTEMLWLVNHNPDQTLNEIPTYTNNTISVCWKGIAGNVPALSVIVLYKRGTSYHTARVAYDPNNGRGNNFTFAGGLLNSCGQTNVYRQTLTFNAMGINIGGANPDIVLALRLRPLYSDAFLYIDSGGTAIASQGNVVTSTGTTGSGITRKIVVSQQFRSPPSIFDAAVVSQTSFSH